MDHGEVTSLILDLSAAFTYYRLLDHIPSFSIVFNIGLIFMALLLIGTW